MSLENLTNNELVSKAKNGNKGPAFEILYRREKDKLTKIVFKIVKNQQDAEDIVSESFDKAWRSLDSFRPVYQFSTWLCRIAINTSINLLRKKKNAYFESIEDSEFVAQRCYEPSYGLDNREIASKIKTSLDKIDGRYAQCARLAFLEKMSYLEISEMMNISIGTVKSRLHRARRILKADLEEFRN